MKKIETEIDDELRPEYDCGACVCEGLGQDVIVLAGL